MNYFEKVNMAEQEGKKESKKNNDEDLLLKLYEQDCNNYRYQDSLRWSRFKVAMTMEALFLAIAFTNTIVNSSILYYRGTILLLLSFLIYIIFTLARKDSEDSKAFMKRIMIFEKSLIEKTGKKELEFKTNPVRFIPILRKMRGESLMKVIIWIICILNIFITLCWYFGWIFPHFLFSNSINTHQILTRGS
jgi:hypothetical protein